MQIRPVFIGIILAAIAVTPSFAHAEDGSGVRLLKPKSLNPSLQKERRRKKKNALRSRRRQRPIRHFETLSFSSLVHTPLVREHGIHNRFAAIGLDGLFSLPIAKKGAFHLEFGLGLSLARGNVPGVTPTFSSLYIQLPLHLRYRKALGKRWDFEVFAGLQQTLFEYDSRSGTNGGFFFLTPVFDNMDPSVGMGFSYRLSDPIALRLLLGYLKLAFGLSF